MAARRNATLARGVLSQDGWRIFNSLFNDRRWRRASGRSWRGTDRHRQ